MRHSKVINHLGRTSSHRKAMMSNMATSLILHKRITTTTAKAKALRTFIEPIITKSKEDSTHSRRVVFGYLKDKTATAELFRDISPKIGDRPGGYTRILKIGNRFGDNADMCILELVDYNEAMLGGGEAAKTKSTRRRRSPKKKEEAVSASKVADTAKETTEPVAEAEKSEAPVAQSEKIEDPLADAGETAEEKVSED